MHLPGWHGNSITPDESKRVSFITTFCSVSPSHQHICVITHQHACDSVRQSDHKLQSSVCPALLPACPQERDHLPNNKIKALQCTGTAKGNILSDDKWFERDYKLWLRSSTQDNAKTNKMVNIAESYLPRVVQALNFGLRSSIILSIIYFSIWLSMTISPNHKIPDILS